MWRTLTVLSLVSLSALTAFANDPWILSDHRDEIKVKSCDGADRNRDWASVPLRIEPVTVNPRDRVAPDFSGVRLYGAWALSSDWPGFGGLSGLAFVDSNTLLSVSDAGTFVELTLQDGRPGPKVRHASMRLSTPFFWPRKMAADAEGLDVKDGIAFVGFERGFRILAFALQACGPDARGHKIGSPPNRFDRQRIRANAGPEALWHNAAQELKIGYEQPWDGLTVTGTLRNDGAVTLSTHNDRLEPGFRLVGGDHLVRNGDAVMATLYRAYNRESGNRAELRVETASGLRRHLKLDPPMVVDNFEGVALMETDRGVRAYLISDDNFSDRQRTLLYAFDVDVPQGLQPN